MPAMEAIMLRTFDHTDARSAQASAPQWVALLRTPISFGFAVIGRWIDRSNQRTALAELDDHLLRDIGLSGKDARREASKPFWR
jgi:uncharacterized protein YjiS (DUF1127 family)